VTVDPTGKFAYVANSNSNNVSAYAINGITGALTPVAGSPFPNPPSGLGGYSVTVDSTGQFAYVANVFSNNVSAYAINGITGALTPVAGSPVPAGGGPYSVTVDPTGQFAYVANHGGGVSAHTINGATGALSLVGEFTAGTTPRSVTVDPTGQFAYVANEFSNNVSAYVIKQSGGLLPLCGSPFPAGSGPLSVTTTAGPTPPPPSL
jgi:6-phosphogluconolactonase (cycloisomerase 2 family)